MSVGDGDGDGDGPIFVRTGSTAIIGTFSHRDTGSPNHAESYCHQNLPSDQSRALLAAAERRHRPTLASRPNLWIRRGPNFARLRKCLCHPPSSALLTG